MIRPRSSFRARPGIQAHQPSRVRALRFSYWVARLKRGGEVLAPEQPDDPVQYIDVRDLAAWILQAAQARRAGAFDAIGPSLTRRDFLDQCTDALGSSCTYTWVDQAFMDRHGIRSGSGPRSLPYPMPDSIGDNAHDVSATLDAGLTLRPLADTARDTLLWLQAMNAPVAGLSADEETALLTRWHAGRLGLTPPDQPPPRPAPESPTASPPGAIRRGA